MSIATETSSPAPRRRGAVEAVRLEANIGAEIRGLDLSGPLTPALKETLLALLLEHQVIFFRDQDVDTDQQRALGRLFGELGTDSLNGVDEVQVLKTGNYYGTNWHADATYREEPFFISILRSIVAPELGGDTVFSSGVSAYRNLPDDVKQLVGGLSAIHRPHSKARLLIHDEARRAAYLKAFSGAEHPVVTRHALTGVPRRSSACRRTRARSFCSS